MTRDLEPPVARGICGTCVRRFDYTDLRFRAQEAWHKPRVGAVMTTFLLQGFRRRDVFIQRAKDEVGIVVDANSALDAIAIAKKILGGMACLFDGRELESAPDEIKRRLMPLAKLEACIVAKPNGADFMIR